MRTDGYHYINNFLPYCSSKGQLNFYPTEAIQLATLNTYVYTYTHLHAPCGNIIIIIMHGIKCGYLFIYSISR